MEAIGCAKPAVWKNARRRVYWLSVPVSLALAKLVEAKPGVSLESRLKLLHSAAPIASTTDHRVIAETLE